MAKKIDRTIVGWRAWYTGGRRYDSTMCSWEELPTTGLLYVILYQRTRPLSRTLSSRTIFWKEVTPDGDVYANNDLADARISDEAWDAHRVKWGKWVSDEEYGRVFDEAQALLDVAPDESLRA